MPIEFHTFWVSKRGNTPDEYEDAFAGDAAAGRFAIADGATESGFAGHWARCLVKHFVDGPDCPPRQWAGSLRLLQEQWAAEYGSRPLPWYAEAKLQQGAFATFLGLALRRRRRRTFRLTTVAVGDSCLFHTRGTRLLRAFPIWHSRQFGNCPSLLGSRTPEETASRRADWKRGTTRPGDRLWMMTDALAQWFLSRYEMGELPWKEMAPLLANRETNESFVQWITGLREANRIRNDDVTLLAISL